MLEELHIKGFRGFKELRVAPLGRVNLFVGKNSAGKTAVLDAIYMLEGEIPYSVLGSLIRRQEAGRRASDGILGFDALSHSASVANLFHGRDFDGTIDIAGRVRGQKPIHSFAAVVVPFSSAQFPNTETALQVNVNDAPGRLLPLYPDGTYRYSPTQLTAPDNGQVLYIGTQAPDVSYLSGLWDEIMLTDDESLAIDALRIIEPRVERIAFRGESQDRNILVKLRGERSPFLLGSLGEGMRRLLALALHLVPAQEACLLIDEIDTGLHYSVQTAMWRLVIETAKRLDIQVFATTHSLDCIHALAEVQKELQLTSEDLTLHRLEPGLDHTISYAPEEIAVAAERQIEVR